MNEKEVAEIRRRFRPDKSNITCVRGCYVNDKHEIVSEFRQSLALTPQEEAEKLLTILKLSLIHICNPIFPRSGNLRCVLAW